MTRAALKELIPGGQPSEGDISFYFSLSMAMWLWVPPSAVCGSAAWATNTAACVR